jgi:hypothetical protein
MPKIAPVSRERKNVDRIYCVFPRAVCSRFRAGTSPEAFKSFMEVKEEINRIFKEEKKVFTIVFGHRKPGLGKAWIQCLLRSLFIVSQDGGGGPGTDLYCGDMNCYEVLGVQRYLHIQAKVVDPEHVGTGTFCTRQVSFADPESDAFLTPGSRMGKKSRS